MTSKPCMKSGARAGLASILVACLCGLAPAVRAQEEFALSAAEKSLQELNAAPAAERTRRLEEGARAEGRLSIIQTIRGELGNGQIELFRRRYPFIAVDSTSDIGSPEATERMYAEELSGRHLTDVINVAIVDLPELLQHDFLARYASPATAAILPGYKPFGDPKNRWTLSFWSDRGMSYNPDLVPPDHAPHGWMDLCKPFFRGNVSFEGAQSRFLLGLHAIMGEGVFDFFRCIGANEPIVQRGLPERVQMMLNGDHMVVADSYLYQGLAEQRKNPAAHYAIAYPGPIIATYGGVSINRNTPHPYASALFVDWMLGNEEQQYLSRRLRGPVTLKHPYLQDDAVLVATPAQAPAGLADRLVNAWLRDAEHKL